MNHAKTVCSTIQALRDGNVFWIILDGKYGIAMTEKGFDDFANACFGKVLDSKRNKAATNILHQDIFGRQT